MKTALIVTSAALSLGAATLIFVGQTTTAVSLAAGALLVLLLLPTVNRRRPTPDQVSVDLDQTRLIREQQGRVAAVRDIHRQDTELSLVEATRTVDTL